MKKLKKYKLWKIYTRENIYKLILYFSDLLKKKSRVSPEFRVDWADCKSGFWPFETRSTCRVRPGFIYAKQSVKYIIHILYLNSKIFFCFVFFQSTTFFHKKIKNYLWHWTFLDLKQLTVHCGPLLSPLGLQSLEFFKGRGQYT